MNKTELVSEIAIRTGMPQDAALRALNASIDIITDAVGENDQVVIPGFGTFSKKHRNARKGRNPHTGEEIEIPASGIPSFRAGKRLKEAAR